MPDPWNKRFDVSHALSVLGEEIQSLHPRFQVTDVLARALPPLSFQRVRTALYRASGISIGPRSLIAGRLELIGPGDITSRLTIGSDCWLNSPIFADLTSDITIGNGVTLGHHVVIVTADHAIGPKERRAGPVVPAPVVIEDGAWIGAGVTVLPGARVGTGSVVGAGSLVVGTLPARSPRAGQAGTRRAADRTRRDPRRRTAHLRAGGAGQTRRGAQDQSSDSPGSRLTFARALRRGSSKPAPAAASAAAIEGPGARIRAPRRLAPLGSGTIPRSGWGRCRRPPRAAPSPPPPAR